MEAINDLKSIDSFIELINDLVFIKDTNGVYIGCNKSFLEFIEKEKDEVIGKKDIELFSKDNSLNFTTNDEDVLNSKTTRIYEEKFIKKDGDIEYFETTKKPIFDKNLDSLILFCVAKNITTKKQYEYIHNDNKKLLEHIAIEENLKNNLDSIVNLAEKRNPNTRCSILVLDKKKKFLLSGSAPSLPKFYNDAIHGIKIGDKIGSCGSAAYKKQRVIVEDINNHENWENYLALTNEANVHSCWSEPIFSSNNEILGTFAIYNSMPKKPSDFELNLISSYASAAAVAIEKYQNYKVLHEKELLIAHQSKMVSMGEMIANIAHQWRQPLNAITTGASGLKFEKEFGLLTDEKFQESCSMIQSSAEYLSNTIDDFKNYIKGDRVKSDFYLKNIADSFLRIVEGSVKSFDLNVEVNIDENIKLYGYPSELKQCFINIFSNAKDALNEKDIDYKLIRIEAKEHEDKVLIKFIDNGGGIDEKIKAKIFEAYFTTKGETQGTGLGLHMTYQLIVEGMFGNLYVNNIDVEYKNLLSRGAEFTIELPKMMKI